MESIPSPKRIRASGRHKTNLVWLKQQAPRSDHKSWLSSAKSTHIFAHSLRFFCLPFIQQPTVALEIHIIVRTPLWPDGGCECVRIGERGGLFAVRKIGKVRWGKNVPTMRCFLGSPIRGIIPSLWSYEYYNVKMGGRGNAYTILRCKHAHTHTQTHINKWHRIYNNQTCTY